MAQWGHLDSNQEPTSYEPAALTVELCPQKGKEKIAAKERKEYKKMNQLENYFLSFC